MLVFLALACTGSDPKDSDSAADTADTAVDGPGSLLLSFSLDPDLIPEMKEPDQGTFRGSVYAEDQATATGPIDGAVSLFDFESDPIDFGTTGETPVTVATRVLAADIVWVLGCFDGDANDCDCYDPITIPNENKTSVPGAVETPYTVTMSLLTPC